jgi:serine/threonine protein kinase
MSIATQATDIVIPGYVLSERIGSGGYAEVWRAEAPGGIAKAVKIVYGYYNDEFAAQEMKALERVKGVRHPFLLSLERFEVVNGRLAILTELADMSLDQRLDQCRASGLVGIPRDELLRYIADAAEALDFLAQRHSLLHLDIKPENLLILGDHVKVADFGLVKELATRTQNSLVSGMTPTYAAPEMFDDEPTAQSDQYSLAIVYQHMLVGTLPFAGRTAAQLAKQHTLADPQLGSLPPNDRPAVAQALAKKAEDRFPSCRAFVDALLHRAGQPSAASPGSVPNQIPAPSPPVPNPDDTKPSSVYTTIRRGAEKPAALPEPMVTRPVKRESPQPKPQPAAPRIAPQHVLEDIVDVTVPLASAELRLEQPTLYIAAGGVGIQTLCRLRALTAPTDDTDEPNSAIEALAFDTDREELRGACSNRWKSPLSSLDTLHLPLRLPKSYDDSREILGWVSRRWLYNIPRSLETRGYRPLGRVALVDHSRRVRNLIDEKLQSIAKAGGAADANGQPRDTTIRIVILAGTGGGTGAGMAIDLANAARTIAASHQLQIEVHGFLICTCFATNNVSPLLAANTYSLLSELHHVTALGNESNSETASPAQLFESRKAPFDSVYWVPTTVKTADSCSVDGPEVAAKYLALETVPEIRAAFRSCRAAVPSNEKLSNLVLNLRKIGYASLADHQRSFISAIATELADAMKALWLTTDTSADWEKLVRDEQLSTSVPKLEPNSEDGNGLPVVKPVNEATSLALRGRLKEFMSLQFTSEVVHQIRCQLQARDDRGRPLIQPRDAKQIADAARTAFAALAARMQQNLQPSRFAESLALLPLVAAASQRVLKGQVQKFDYRQPERFLSAESAEEFIQNECRALLEECLGNPQFSAAIRALIEVDTTIESLLEEASVNPLQCGSERRTLLFMRQHGDQTAALQTLKAARPLANAVPVPIDDLMIVQEEAGISPQSLAQGFERLFPGVGDAARRLHTRTDIDWQELL